MRGGGIAPKLRIRSPVGVSDWVMPMKLARYVKFREEKFGGVLFETRSERVFTLNETAAAVVREIEKGGVREEIVARLRDVFDGPDGTIGRDANAFIADLGERGLIED